MPVLAGVCKIVASFLTTTPFHRTSGHHWEGTLAVLTARAPLPGQSFLADIGRLAEDIGGAG